MPGTYRPAPALPSGCARCRHPCVVRRQHHAHRARWCSSSSRSLVLRLVKEHGRPARSCSLLIAGVAVFVYVNREPARGLRRAPASARSPTRTSPCPLCDPDLELSSRSRERQRPPDEVGELHAGGSGGRRATRPRSPTSSPRGAWSASVRAASWWCGRDTPPWPATTGTGKVGEVVGRRVRRAQRAELGDRAPVPRLGAAPWCAPAAPPTGRRRRSGA